MEQHEYKSTLFNPNAKKPGKDDECIFNVFGQFIGALIMIGFYLLVPVLVIATCLKILFF